MFPNKLTFSIPGKLFSVTHIILFCFSITSQYCIQIILYSKYYCKVRQVHICLYSVFNNFFMLQIYRIKSIYYTRCIITKNMVNWFEETRSTVWVIHNGNSWTLNWILKQKGYCLRQWASNWLGFRKLMVVMIVDMEIENWQCSMLQS